MILPILMYHQIKTTTLSGRLVARATNPLQFFLKVAAAYEDRRA